MVWSHVLCSLHCFIVNLFCNLFTYCHLIALTWLHYMQIDFIAANVHRSEV